MSDVYALRTREGGKNDDASAGAIVTSALGPPSAHARAAERRRTNANVAARHTQKREAQMKGG